MPPPNPVTLAGSEPVRTEMTAAEALAAMGVAVYSEADTEALIDAIKME